MTDDDDQPPPLEDEQEWRDEMINRDMGWAADDDRNK